MTVTPSSWPPVRPRPNCSATCGTTRTAAIRSWALSPTRGWWPGAIHEAHEGVLFLDELPHLGHIQRYILTAMQEKRFPISGRNPQSAGASVKVVDVPCDFIFVGACNIQDLEQVLSPLRSRTAGNGYEVLVNTTMEDNDQNRARLAQFIAQEIMVDGRIPQATRAAVEGIIKEARQRAKRMDSMNNALTLRLRELGGLLRAAGDIAVVNGDPMIELKHLEQASDAPAPPRTRSRTGMVRNQGPGHRHLLGPEGEIPVLFPERDRRQGHDVPLVRSQSTWLSGMNEHHRCSLSV